MLKTAEREAVTSPAVRDFLRCLNITLKSARMYGMEHTETLRQTEQSWKRLQEALAGRNGEALQLAVSEKRLLVDGVAAKNGPTEQSFAQLLDAADIASITFRAEVKREALVGILRGFSETGKTLEGLGVRLKETLGDESQTGLRINEVRFVPAGSEEAAAEGPLTARLLAETFRGEPGNEVHAALRDPVKLLELLASAEAASLKFKGETIERPARVPGGTSAADHHATEEDVTAAVRALANLSRDAGPNESRGPGSAREELASLPSASQEALQRTVAKFAEGSPARPPAESLVLAIAERMAVGMAQQQYERGEASVEAVAAMLGRLNREIEALRKTAGVYEKKLKEAGYAGEEAGESLEETFWNEASDDSKRQLLLSSGAWRIPPRQVRKFFDRLVEQNEGDALQEAILCYAACLGDPDPAARRKTLQGLKQVAEYLPRLAGSALQEVIRDLGKALANETDEELREETAATFVALSLEAASRRRYAAVFEVLEGIEHAATANPGLAEGLRSRIGIENRIPDFLEEAMRLPELPSHLVEVLRKLPVASIQHIAGRMSRSVRRRERDRLVSLGKELGPAAVEALEKFLQANTPAASMIVVGLLSHLRPEALPGLLRPRLREWSGHYHDTVVRQLASAGAPLRGRLLTQLLDVFDVAAVPMAIDEIGMSDDAPMAAILTAIAAREIPSLAHPYLQVKAIEALGRLRAESAAPLLERIASERGHPREVVIVALEALEKLKPGEAEETQRASGITPHEMAKLMAERPADSPGVRQRLYKRFKLPRAAAARLSSPDGEFSVMVHQLGLGGGTLTCASALPAGATGRLKVQSGGVAISAKVVLRGPRHEQIAFEIVDIDLEERYKLRTLLAGIGK
ncbi:MAG TPA: hypothetical protein VMJ93_01690 [Verrucomicrobiae bacterium]|nr:hypothetical protein [Verrucomicrobiae bacterium]